MLCEPLVSPAMLFDPQVLALLWPLVWQLHGIQSLRTSLRQTEKDQRTIITRLTANTISALVTHEAISAGNTRTNCECRERGAASACTAN